MSLGTIHPVATDLFLVEGRSPVASVVVLRRRREVYLLGSGVGPEQRRSIRALVASYGPLEALTLLSSSARLPDINDDLVGDLPARRRRHIRPTMDADAPATSVSDVGEPYDVLGGSGWVMVGARPWPGWPVDHAGLQILRLDAYEGGVAEPSVAFFVSDQDLLVLTGSSARNADDAIADGDPVAILAENVRLISPGYGPVCDADEFRIQPGASTVSPTWRA